MGRPAGWMTELTGRAPMKSPGKPSLRRDVERLFWHEIAKGPKQRGGRALRLAPPKRLVAGGFESVGEWRRSWSSRYRVGICVLRSARRSRWRGRRARVFARSPAPLNRSPSTISRELRRKAATRGGKLKYRASVAQWKAELMARRPKTAKLAADERLRHYVQDRLAGQIRRPGGPAVPGPAAKAWKGRNKPRRQDRRWATAWRPGQIANRLKIEFPDDESMRISHEAIYQALYVQGRGALKRELFACLRTGRALRVRALAPGLAARASSARRS